MIGVAIWDALKDDAGIVAALAEYENAPAIFTGPVPEQVPCPFIKINESGGQNAGCRANKGGIAIISVQVFDDKDLTQKPLRDLADAIQVLLDRHALPLLDTKGFWNQGCIADLPQATNEGAGFPGYTIRVSVRHMKKD